jgi:hypothetical protein
MRARIKKILLAVPTEDLSGLKSICIRTVVHKNKKKRYKRWGGCLGQFYRDQMNPDKYGSIYGEYGKM